MKLRLSISLAALAAAAVQAAPPPRAPAVAALSACRAIADNGARLACFDKQAAVIDEAEKHGDLYVADREEVQKTKRTLFGLTLPNFSLFSKGPGGDEPALTQIEGTLTRATFFDRKWTFVLSDGARWRQTEAEGSLDPRPGDKILIRRAAMGSYLLKVNKDRAVRAERIN